MTLSFKVWGAVFVTRASLKKAARSSIVVISPCDKATTSHKCGTEIFRVIKNAYDSLIYILSIVLEKQFASFVQINKICKFLLCQKVQILPAHHAEYSDAEPRTGRDHQTMKVGFCLFLNGANECHGNSMK